MMNLVGYKTHALLARHARQHQRQEARSMQFLAGLLWSIPTGLLLLMLAAIAADAVTGAQYVSTFVQWARS